MRIFVCNVATQHGETDGFSVTDHLEALERHAGRGLFHAVIANNNIVPELPEAWQSTPVTINRANREGLRGARLVEADVIAEENRYRHDPDKLAAIILRLYDDRDSYAAAVNAPRADEAILLSR